MVIKRALIVILGVTLCNILSACSNNSGNPTYKEYDELKKSVSINDIEISKIKDDFYYFILKLYSPSSQEELDNSYKSIENYTEEGFIEELKRSVNSYKPEVKQTVSINSIDFGYKENQFDQMSKILVDVTVSSDKFESARIMIEFTFNGNGKIFKYDIWQYYLQ